MKLRNAYGNITGKGLFNIDCDIIKEITFLQIKCVKQTKEAGYLNNKSFLNY